MQVKPASFPEFAHQRHLTHFGAIRFHFILNLPRFRVFYMTCRSLEKIRCISFQEFGCSRMLRISLFRDVSEKALGVVGALAFLVLLVGWGMDIDWLVRMRSDAHAMVPSTSICFIMACGAAYLLTEKTASCRVLGMFLLGAVSAIAGINILLATLLYGVKLEELFGVNVGLDDRMATGTSLGFLLLCFRMATWHRNSDFSFVAAIVGVIVSGGLLLLLLADARAFDTLPLFRETSLPTLLFFTLVFTGTLAPGYRD